MKKVAVPVVVVALLAILPCVSMAANEVPAKPIRDYRAFKDEPVAPWREVNDRVGRIGGWKVYAREQMQPAPAQSAPAAGAAK